MSIILYVLPVCALITLTITFIIVIREVRRESAAEYIADCLSLGKNRINFIRSTNPLLRAQIQDTIDRKMKQLLETVNDNRMKAGQKHSGASGDLPRHIDWVAKRTNEEEIAMKEIGRMIRCCKRLDYTSPFKLETAKVSQSDSRGLRLAG